MLKAEERFHLFFSRWCPPAVARKHFILSPCPRQKPHWDQPCPVTCLQSWGVLHSCQGHNGRSGPQIKQHVCCWLCLKMWSRSISIKRWSGLRLCFPKRVMNDKLLLVVSCCDACVFCLWNVILNIFLWSHCRFYFIFHSKAQDIKAVWWHAPVNVCSVCFCCACILCCFALVSVYIEMHCLFFLWHCIYLFVGMVFHQKQYCFLPDFHHVKNKTLSTWKKTYVFAKAIKMARALLWVWTVCLQ